MKQVAEQCKYWIGNIPPFAPSGCIPAPRECEVCKRFSRFEPKPSEASAEALRAKKYKPEEQDDRLLTSEEQDACTPSKEQIEKYLVEPNDAVASALSSEDKYLVAKCILYGTNIAKAQRDLTASIKDAECKKNLKAHGDICLETGKQGERKRIIEILKSIKLEVQDKKGRGVWKTNVYDAYGIVGRLEEGG